MNTRWIIFACGFVALLSSGTANADTETYTGTGAFETQELTMNLGNGHTVFNARSEGFAAISTEPPVLLKTKCMGLGLIAGENEYDATVYCTFRQDDRKSFDVLANTGPSGGTAKVIGGSGKWKGTTGSASFARMSTTETGGSFSYELTITVP